MLCASANDGETYHHRTLDLDSRLVVAQVAQIAQRVVPTGEKRIEGRARGDAQSQWVGRETASSTAAASNGKR